jgi:hypothetical protein
MDFREWIPEIPPTNQWDAPPSLQQTVPYELPFYQSEVVGLKESTSPAEARIVHAALRSLGEQPRPFVPEAWRPLFDHLLRAEPARQQELASQVAEVVGQVFELHAPEASTAEVGTLPHIAQAPSSTPFQTLNDLQFSIPEMLDIRSRCRFAQTCRENRALVQLWRTKQIEKLLSDKKLRKLLPFFFAHTPQVSHPESFDQWPSEAVVRVLPAIARQVEHSGILRSTDVRELLEDVVKAHKGILPSLTKALQASYDMSLCIACETLASPWIDFQSGSALPAKAKTAEEFFQQTGGSRDELHIVPDSVQAHPHMTCVPEQVFLRSPLRAVNLSNNGIVALPESFQFLSKLSRLVFQHNNLTAIPDSFGKLSQLTSIDLSYNKLRTLPESFGALRNLEELDLSGNPMTSLPDSFQALPKLQTLRLLNVKLNAAICRKLPAGVNVFIDSKYRYHPIERLKMFPHHVHVHYATA